MTKTREIVASKTRREWAAVINADWRKSIESIIQTGRDLIAAKKDLPNGQFGEMINTDLDFGPRTAQNLMDIATHPSITNANDRSRLPARWTVLRHLARLSEEDFDWAQERGLLNPNMSTGAADAIRKAREPNEDTIVRAAINDRHLPKPSEARDIARETGRFVAASDGRVYSGATEEEGAEASRITTQTYAVVDAINLISSMGDPLTWLREAPRFQLRDLHLMAVEDATRWLESLAGALTWPEFEDVGDGE